MGQIVKEIEERLVWWIVGLIGVLVVGSVSFIVHVTATRLQENRKDIQALQVEVAGLKSQIEHVRRELEKN